MITMKSGKRTIRSLSIGNTKRRKSEEQMTTFQRILQECGLELKKYPEKCIATKDTVYIIRDIKKILKQNDVEIFLSDFETACDDRETFKHFLFQNIVRKTREKTYKVDNSVIRILLNVTFLQTKIINYIFDKVSDLLDHDDIGLWVKMILKSFTNLVTVESSEELSTKLIDLLDLTSDKFVRLDIISAIPGIIGDREHDNVALEMSRILSNDSSLIPSILDCLTHLCLSEQQFKQLQTETLALLQPSNATYFSNFVTFLLTPEGNLYEDSIQGLRKELEWSSVVMSEEDIATSQTLTATEIRKSMLSSEAKTKAWLQIISNCKCHTDHKPIDIILFLIIASLSDVRQKDVEHILRKQIETQILKKELLDKTFLIFKPILKEYIRTMISLANSLLNPGADPLVGVFGEHMHMVMFSELTECRPLIISELLQLLLNCKKTALNTLNILNNIAYKYSSVMNVQSSQMMKLLDRLDDMNLNEKKAVMNLLCCLAYTFENSGIRDELHIIIKKEVASSTRSIKFQGILAGIHAVKYLMKSNDTCDDQIPEHVNFTSSKSYFRGDLMDAAEIIELIYRSTVQFPDMMVYFYDQLCVIINQATDINESFLRWLTSVLTNSWADNFLVNTIENEIFDGIKLSMQLGLNRDTDVVEEWAVNIAGLTFEDKREMNIEVMSSLFQLITMLQYKEKCDLSEIDAMLGCPIVMPIIDTDAIGDLSETSAKKVQKCYLMCVNWIRELLNAFASQGNDNFKPKIINRIQQLMDLEKDIDIIWDKAKKSEYNDTTLEGTSKSQQTQNKSKATAKNNTQYRPLDLTLMNIIQYNLTQTNWNETEITVKMLSYILSYINFSLEKILVPHLKKKTYFNKETVGIYNYEDADKQAHSIKDILPKVMTHMDLLISFLDRHIIVENDDSKNLDQLHVMESLASLEHIYNLLTIYFRWIEFKNRNNPLLQSSLEIVARVEDDQLPLNDLLTSIAKAFQKHEKHIITISAAASLMQFLRALQDLSTGPNVSTILKGMAKEFLSKRWNCQPQPEKKTLYNESLDSLIKVYLDNITIHDLNNIASFLVDEVQNLRDNTSVLSSFNSISKSNIHILLKKLGLTLSDKVKCLNKGGFTNEELVEMWKTVANILKFMSDMVTTIGLKNISSRFVKHSIPILRQFLSKGFPILKIEFKDNRQTILDILKDFQTTIPCLRKCLNDNKNTLRKKIPIVEELLTGFTYKTKDLLQENDCTDALKMFNVKNIPHFKKQPKKACRTSVHNETVAELDDDLPDDLSDDPSDVDDPMHVDSVGISEMI